MEYCDADEKEAGNPPFSDYLAMSDEALKRYTVHARNKMVMHVRKSKEQLTEQQRWYLAQWIFDKDNVDF